MVIPAECTKGTKAHSSRPCPDAPVDHDVCGRPPHLAPWTVYSPMSNLREWIDLLVRFATEATLRIVPIMYSPFCRVTSRSHVYGLGTR